MRLYYKGTDITEQAGLTRCECREGFGGVCDRLEITADSAQKWYHWQPQTDDEMEAELGAYRTGKMYLNTMESADGKMTLIATSMPAAAARRASGCYEDVTLAELMSLCAAECGMGSALYGADGEIRYPRLRRLTESAPAFMGRILQLEGMAFKTAGGRFAAIDITAMQARDAGRTLYLAAGQRGVRYTRRGERRYSSLTVKTPYCTCTAEDTAVYENRPLVLTAPPALDAVQGGRWARGLLLMRNRQAETLEIETAFDAAFFAMARIDIESETDMAGRWMADEATHDLIRGRSRAVLHRCVESIR